MDKELIANINNKLTPAHTALEMLTKGKEVNIELLKTALESLKEAERLLNEH